MLECLILLLNFSCNALNVASPAMFPLSPPFQGYLHIMHAPDLFRVPNLQLHYYRLSEQPGLTLLPFLVLTQRTCTSP
jgi:hypothetical protein